MIKRVRNIEINLPKHNLHYVEFFITDIWGSARGTCSLYLSDDNDTGRLENFYIVKSFRNKGYGTKLVRSIEKYVRKNTSCKYLLVNSYKNAIDFYEGLGYKRIKDVEPRNNLYPMIKKLEWRL
jgi:GNAT superfamily N-acetyltransferase